VVKGTNAPPNFYLIYIYIYIGYGVEEEKIENTRLRVGKRFMYFKDRFKSISPLSNDCSVN
jgi:hypothetical protein